MGKINIDLPKEKIAEFCRKWKVKEFELFGSVLQEDFGPSSDIDVLVTFEPDARHTLFDHVDMQEELNNYFQKER